MKKIAFILPYFGKLPGDGFRLWLLSCKMNSTIDWLLYTDDLTDYDYPSNVKVNICTLADIKKRAQKYFEFEISLERPRKLCDYKAAYGEIFADDLCEYDYWGYCDIDLVWGDLRKYFTDDILNRYERIGYQGHCLLYKNSNEVIKRYKTCIDNITNYKEVYSSPCEYCFDENGMDDIYNALGIEYYNETIFAHLEKYEYGFFLKYLPKEMDYKNKNQVFLWDKGQLKRFYLYNEKIYEEEYMYIHFFCRPIKFKYKKCSEEEKFLIYADAVINYDGDITPKLIKKYSRNNAIKYYMSSIWYNRKKLSPRRIWGNIRRMISYRRKN